METKWIKVDSWKDIPNGEWLALLDNGEMHTMRMRPTANKGQLAVIGGRFAFDHKPITHYCELPEVPSC